MRCTSKNGFTAFANTLESCCGSCAFFCATSLNVRIHSSFTERAQVVTEVVCLVCVVVRLTIAKPAGVGIVRAEVIWVGVINVSLATRSSHSAFSTVTYCAYKDTILVSSAKLGRLRADSSAVGSALAFTHIATSMRRISPIILPELDATPGSPAPVCSAMTLQLGNWGIRERSSAGTWPSSGEFGVKLSGRSCKNEGHWDAWIGRAGTEGMEESTKCGLMVG